jgi:hypothetical protein
MNFRRCRKRESYASIRDRKRSECLTKCDVKIRHGRRVLQVLDTGMKRERSGSRNTSCPIACTRRTQFMNTSTCMRECLARPFQQSFPFPLGGSKKIDTSNTDHNTQHEDPRTEYVCTERFIAPPLLHLCPSRSSSTTVEWPILLCLRSSNSNNTHRQ